MTEPHDHAEGCAYLYGDGPDAPFECECKRCCPLCVGELLP